MTASCSHNLCCSHTSLLEILASFPFAGVTILREVCMSAAKVQLECKWINTSELIHTHHTHKHILSVERHAHTSACISVVYVECMNTCSSAYTRGHMDMHGLTNKHTLTHTGCLAGTPVSPLLSTWLCCAPHCAPGMPAIWNQTPMDQHPAGAIHCSFSGATADAEDIPLGTHWCILCKNRKKIDLFIAVIA